MKLDPLALISKPLSLAALAVMLAATAFAQTESIIYTFPSGSTPSGVVLDAKGNLYGTTFSGGSNYAGVVFELSPSGTGTWTETELFSFSFNGPEGADPDSGVILDAKGNLYGKTEGGGANGAGAVFELSPQADGSWTETTIFSFPAGTSSSWASPLTIDGSGNLYGVTGSSFYANTFGSVFELQPGSNGTWTQKTLYTFKGGNDGGYPGGQRLVLDSSGNVYGSTIQNGAHDYGVVFEVVRGSNGGWTEKILHAFTGGSDGSATNTNLTFNAAGNLYGNSPYSIFELVPGTNGTWTKKDLHIFTGGSDGANADSALIFDKSGHLFGTTMDGGKHRGTVFALAPLSGGMWGEKILYKFLGGSTDGEYPSYYGLAIDAHGTLYGTTQFGGSSSGGVVFTVAP